MVLFLGGLILRRETGRLRENIVRRVVESSRRCRHCLANEINGVLFDICNRGVNRSRRDYVNYDFPFIKRDAEINHHILRVWNLEEKKVS